MISQTAEYALRAMVDLAYHAGESRTTQQIADATRVPPGYLAKVLKDLARHQLVHSQRGPKGGFALMHDPSRITVYDILAAVDPPKRITRCPLDLPEHRAKLCPLHQRLDDALAGMEKVFRTTTIAEVTASPGTKPVRGAKGKSAALTISGGLAPAPNPTGRKQ